MKLDMLPLSMPLLHFCPNQPHTLTHLLSQAPCFLPPLAVSFNAVNVAFPVMWPTLASHVLHGEKQAKGTSLRHIIARPCAEPVHILVPFPNPLAQVV
jgi:hypothetical protein